MRLSPSLFRSLVVTAAFSFGGCAPSSPPTVPNLVLVTIDTLRPDHTSAYGYVRDTTPALREFAATATRFDAAYAPQGMTAPSHATLFSGLHPLGHRLIDNGQPFEPAQPLLAERLRAAGYATGAFVSSYPLKKRFGFARGFDSYDDEFSYADRTVDLERWQGEPVEGAFDRNARATLDRALAWLRDRTREPRPFFLWAHLFEPHTPLEPDPSVRDAFLNAPLPDSYHESFRRYVDLYDAEILYADRQLARLFAAIRDAGLDESTLFVVTADHGEGLNEHGWWLHGVSVHEGELRVPLVIRRPGQTTGHVVDTPVQLADLVPTLAEWLPLGLEETPIAPASAAGSSLAAILRGEAEASPVRDLHFFRRFHRPFVVAPMFPVRPDGGASEPKRIVGEELGLRRGRWKLRYAEEQREAALYDLAADPRELHNIADQHKQLTLELVATAKRFADGHGREAARARTALGAKDREALEALGYVE